MAIRTSLTLAVLWASSLLAVAAWALPPRWTPLAEPTILSGNDLGFRVEWMNGQVPTGQIVIRLKEQWVEARVGKPPNFALMPAPPPAPPPPTPPR